MAPVDPASAGLRVEVVWSPKRGELLHSALCLPLGSTVADAIEASGLLRGRSERSDTLAVGVWGRLARADTPLRDQDRVELYRPLTVDPKEARRLRYQRKPAAKTRPIAKRKAASATVVVATASSAETGSD